MIYNLVWQHSSRSETTWIRPQAHADRTPNTHVCCNKGRWARPRAEMGSDGYFISLQHFYYLWSSAIVNYRSKAGSKFFSIKFILLFSKSNLCWRFLVKQNHILQFFSLHNEFQKVRSEVGGGRGACWASLIRCGPLLSISHEINQSRWNENQSRLLTLSRASGAGRPERQPICNRTLTALKNTAVSPKYYAVACRPRMRAYCSRVRSDLNSDLIKSGRQTSCAPCGTGQPQTVVVLVSTFHRMWNHRHVGRALFDFLPVAAATSSAGVFPTSLGFRVELWQ